MTTQKKSMKSVFFLTLVGTFLLLPAQQFVTQTSATTQVRDGGAPPALSPWLVSDGGAPPAPSPWSGGGHLVS